MTLLLCGDVMTGRGVDQILPHPGDPHLAEPRVRDARTYVELAERANGPIPRPVAFPYPWGDALTAPEWSAADVRLVNLETSVTQSDLRWQGKDVHYRMHPDNVPCLTAGRIDACALANNHVLDYGRPGLLETLETLRRAGVRVSGTDEAATEAGERVRRLKRQGTVVVASIHWGSNWGYEVPPAQARFAHRLLEAGVDLVHGHSSHHVRRIEVYRNRLVLYGCGNFIDDYEGISGCEEYRSDLVLAYIATLEPGGELVGLRMHPLRMRKMRLARAGPEDAGWLAGALNRIGEEFGSRLVLGKDGALTLQEGGR